MKANSLFINKPKSFWASVRSLSQELGYSKRNDFVIPSFEEMSSAFITLNLDSRLIINDGLPTVLAEELRDYFIYRAKALKEIEIYLMDAVSLVKDGRTVNDIVSRPYNAKTVFETLKAQLSPSMKCVIPDNKQKGDKKAPAYFTGIINMLIEKYSRDKKCDYDPRKLTTFTKNGCPVRTFARRVDGAYPQVVNPVAIWEIKEYYYTTTFGSRVADAVYESILDGMEALEMNEHENIHVKHYLMVDSHYTWWVCGKSYLCRMVDMLNMGLIDEVLFGYEVVDRLPTLVEEWDTLIPEQ